VRRASLPAVALILLSALALAGQARPASVAGGPSRAGRGSIPREMIRAALSYLGVPYVSGGVSRTGLDCSGLVFRALEDATGAGASRGVEALFHEGATVIYPIHLGDLLFFDTESQGQPRCASHVGIYAGSGRFVHAASEGSRTGVIVSRISDPYYRDRFLGARRVVPWRAPVLDVVLTDTAAHLASDDPFPSRERMTIQVFNRMTGGGPMDLTILKDGNRILQTRIAPGAFGPAVIPLTPAVGVWEVLVTRLFKGRELERVTFTVEE